MSETLKTKLARIAKLAAENAEPEFGGMFFRRKLAELTERPAADRPQPERKAA